MKLDLKVLSLAISLLVGFSCKKYDEGPALSLRTKKQRLTGDWTMAAILKDGKDVTSTYYVKTTLLDYHFLIEKDGRFAITGSGQSAGTWELSDHKRDLVLIPDLSAIKETYQIQRLTEKELWVKDNVLGLVTKLKKVK